MIGERVLNTMLGKQMDFRESEINQQLEWSGSSFCVLAGMYLLTRGEEKMPKTTPQTVDGKLVSANCTANLDSAALRPDCPHSLALSYFT
jgi:hypothetical protein